MKKLVISLLLLVIFGSAAAYFGMVSLKVPEDSIGIVFSKTGGFNKKPVLPGKLMWLPEALLPTNVTVFKIPDVHYSLSIKISDVLPNSTTYIEYLDHTADFSWFFNIDISYRIKPESLPQLFSEKALRPETLDEYIASTEERLNGILTSHFKQLFSDTQTRYSTPEISTQLSDIKNTISQQFPHLYFSDVIITDYHYPDFDLYKRTKEHYLAVLSKQSDALITDIQVSAQEKSTQTIKIELLKRYGELFTKYPMLIEFLALDSPNVNKLLPDDWE